MCRSFAQFEPDTALFVLCLDKETRTILEKVAPPSVILLDLEDLELADPELYRRKEERTLIEYYWTLTPSLLRHIFKTQPDIELLTYIDGDVFLFAGVTAVYEDLGEESISIVEHRYSKRHERALNNTGIFNVGILTFRRDKNGTQALEWWRERCIEWCFNRVEDGKFGDQKYLDDWPQRFRGVQVVSHKGVDVAPWNVEQYRVSKNAECVFIDDQPLVAYHFHSLRIVTPEVFELADRDNYNLSRAVVREIYRPYLRALRSAIASVQTVAPDFEAGFTDVGAKGRLGGLLLGWLVWERSS